MTPSITYIWGPNKMDYRREPLGIPKHLGASHLPTFHEFFWKSSNLLPPPDCPKKKVLCNKNLLKGNKVRILMYHT